MQPPRAPGTVVPRRRAWPRLGTGLAAVLLLLGLGVPAAAAVPVGETGSPGVTVTSGDGTLTLRWDLPTQLSPTGFVYGRDGVDANGYGTWASDPLPPTATSATLDKLVNGRAYGIYVEALSAAGPHRVTFTATPGATGPATAPQPAAPQPAAAQPAAPQPAAAQSTASQATPTQPVATLPAAPSGFPVASGTAPVAGGAATGSRVSGLPWNSGAWTQNQGSNAASFVAMRGGVALDSFEVFTTRDSWATTLSDDWTSVVPSGFDPARQDIVMTLPLWPQSNSVSATGTQEQWAQLAGQIRAVDPNAWVRLGWEMNLPSMFWSLTAQNRSAWIASFHQIVTWMHAVAPDLRFVWNPNAGRDQTDADSRAAFQQVKDDVVAYGVDSYDAWPPDVDAAARATHLTAVGYLGESAAYAQANGKLFAVPEWGVACNDSGCQWAGNAGGDNPQYIGDYVGFFRDHAAAMAFECYFDEPNPYIRSALDAGPIGPAAPARYRADLLAAASGP